MKCEELLAMLNEYVDGTVDPAICGEFEQHMAGCNPCRVVVDNIRMTITLYKAGQPYELPPKFQERLHEALRQKWRKKPSPLMELFRKMARDHASLDDFDRTYELEDGLLQGG